MKSKTKSTTKPIYSGQIEGAAGAVKDAYNPSAVAATSAKLGTLADSLISGGSPNAATTYANKILGGEGLVKYDGDPALKAIIGGKSTYKASPFLTGLLEKESTYKPSDYFTNIINSDPASNPALADMIELTGRNIMDTYGARGGTRGLTGGTHIADVITANMADAETGLRYEDFTTQQGRRDDAAKYETGREDTADQFLQGQQLTAATTEAQMRQQAEEAQRQRAAVAAEAEAARKQAAALAAAGQQQAAAEMAMRAEQLDLQEKALGASIAQAAAGMPLGAATQYAGATSSILGPYTSQKSTTSGGVGQLLGGVAGAALGGWASGGFKL